MGCGWGATVGNHVIFSNLYGLRLEEFFRHLNFAMMFCAYSLFLDPASLRWVLITFLFPIITLRPLNKPPA